MCFRRSGLWPAETRFTLGQMPRTVSGFSRIAHGLLTARSGFAAERGHGVVGRTVGAWAVDDNEHAQPVVGELAYPAGCRVFSRILLLAAVPPLLPPPASWTRPTLLDSTPHGGVRTSGARCGHAICSGRQYAVLDESFTRIGSAWSRPLEPTATRPSPGSRTSATVLTVAGGSSCPACRATAWCCVVHSAEPY